MKHYFQNSLRALFLSLSVFLSLPIMAVCVEIDGINYDLVEKTHEATVLYKSSGSYSGDIVIPESVEYEGNYPHEGTTYRVISIGFNAFRGCSGLTSVTIPNSVAEIGIQAFDGCSGLTSVTIPNSVTSIESYAFWGCPGLTSVIIPDNVTYLGERAFQSCPGLTSATIGNSVKRIEKYAFADCRELLDVYCYADKAPYTGDNVFKNSYIGRAYLHVPAASIENYKAKTPWNEFGKIVALTEEGTDIEKLKSENGTTESMFFDLNGRRVQKAQKGIYIQNRKKVLVK